MWTRYVGNTHTPCIYTKEERPAPTGRDEASSPARNYAGNAPARLKGGPVVGYLVDVGDVADDGATAFSVGPYSDEPGAPEIGGLAIDSAAAVYSDRAAGAEIYHTLASHKDVGNVADGSGDDAPTAKVDAPGAWPDGAAEARIVPRI